MHTHTHSHSVTLFCSLRIHTPLSLSLHFVCGVLTVATAAAGSLHVRLAVLLFFGLRKSTDSREEGECNEIFHFVVFTTRIIINTQNFTISFVLTKQSTGNAIQNKSENNS